MIKISNWLAEVISRLIYKYSWPIIISFLIITVLCFFYTVQNLGVNSKTSELFDEDLPFRQVMKQYKGLFPDTEDNIVIVVSGEVPEFVINISDSVAKDLSGRPDLFESVFQPTGEEFFKRNRLLYLDTTGLGTLTDKVVKAKPMISFMAENYNLQGLFSFLGLMTRFSSTQKLEGMFPLFQSMDSVLLGINKGKNSTMSWQNLMGNQSGGYDVGYSFIQVKPVLDYSAMRPAKTAIEEAKKITTKYKSDDLSLRITGKQAMLFEEMGSVMDGAIQASVFALLMVSIMLWIGLRSLRLIAATLLTLVVGLTLTAAFSTWAVGQLNMISMAFAVLYIGLGVDYAIHICLRYRELHREGVGIKKSIDVSLHHIAPALVLSTLTTSIGFYAFVPTAFAGVSELGIIAGTGMFISLLVTLTLLPCLIWKLSALSDRHGVAKSGFKGLVIEKYSTQIRVATIILVVAAIVVLQGVKFDYDPINLRDPESESVSTARELMADQHFTPWTLNIITSDSADLVNLATQIKELGSVGRVVHVYSFIPENQISKIATIEKLQVVLNEMPRTSFEFDAINNEDQSKAIAEFAALLNSPRYRDISSIHNFANHLVRFNDSINQLEDSEKWHSINVLQDGLLISLPYAVEALKGSLEPQEVNQTTLPTELQRRWISDEGLMRLQVSPSGELRGKQEMRKFVSDVQKIAPNATGDLVVTLESGDTVVTAFKQAILYAIVAITLLLLLYLRNIRDTLYILFPLLLAGAFTGALTVVLGIEFNFANIITLPLLLGLGVDNGVHIIHRAKTEKDGKGLLQTSTARAIFFSSLTTLFSFGNLAFSPHRGTASMGLILTLGVLLVIISTLVMLPAFLPKPRETAADTN